VPTQSGVREAPPSTALAIEATDLVKTYGKGDKCVHALSGIGFAVPAGTIFGLLGPNGAGKSTTVKILTTLCRADSGTATVAGIDVDRHPDQVRRAIGYVPQKSCFDPVSTGMENLVQQGRYYGMSSRAAKRRAGELLDRFGLGDAANRLARKWSGGMQRKLDVALGLIHQPEVLFLDEPTTGLDPEARADLWSEVAALSKEGLTVLVTTHYLDEADSLAGLLAIVDRGQIVVTGTPEELKSELAGDTVQIELVQAGLSGRAAALIESSAGVREVIADGAMLRTVVTHGASVLPVVLTTLDAAGIELTSVTVARPSLDDVYLRHAGRAYRQAGAEALR
jgi:ABC-2 type transport system ATP-binding protein